MENYKLVFGIIPLFITAFSYSLYMRDIVRKKTKPHTFSWLVWMLLNGTVFFTQINNGAGAGALVTGFIAIMCFLVFALSLHFGDKNFTKLDWLCLLLALLALSTQYQALNPAYAIIFASIAFIVGFIPTFRKTYRKPYEETLLTYFLNGSKLFIALFAIQQYSLTTVLYPSTLAAANLVFVGFLLSRRTHYKKPKTRQKNAKR